MLQWGRAREGTEGIDWLLKGTGAGELQWGRAREGTEGAWHADYGFMEPASMGPCP